MSGYFDRAIEALQFCAELDNATIDVVGENGEVLEQHPQGRDDEVKMLRESVSILEAANLVLPLIKALDDETWYCVSFKIKKASDGIHVDDMSSAALPDAPKEEK